MAEVVFASSYDEKYPPTNILDNSKNKYFISTGMYPQEICIQFNTVRPIKGVSLSGYGLKRIGVETCESDSAMNFTKQVEEKVENSNKIQNVTLAFPIQARVKVLKLEILEGYYDFFSIHNITFM